MFSLFSTIQDCEVSIACIHDSRLRPELTAITRKGITAPLREAMRVKQFTGLTGIDVGCGRSLDASALTSLDATCYRYDPFFMPLGQSVKPDIAKVDFVLLIYVLNILPRTERALVANLAREILKPNGFIVLGIREDIDAIKGSWVKFDDGFITPKRTFQAFFPRAEFFQIHALFNGMDARRLARGTYILS